MYGPKGGELQQSSSGKELFHLPSESENLGCAPSPYL